MYGNGFFGGMGITECPTCGAYTNSVWEGEVDGFGCGDIICRWCEESHNTERDMCSWHDVVCCDHPCESCVDRMGDGY